MAEVWKRMSREVLLPLFLSRLALILVGWLALTMLHQPARPDLWELDRSGKIVPIAGEISARNRPLTNMWSRWDAGWYVNIAKTGYQFAAGRPSNTAFFPVYPAAMRAVRVLLGSHKDSAWLLAGIIVSNAALIAAMIYLWLLVRLEFDEATARRAVLYFLVFPMTLFLSAVYSESVFLAFVIASFYYARQRRWWLAGIVGACAALSRPTGVMIAVGLAAEYALQCEWNWRKLRADVLAIALVPLALGGFLGFLHYAQGTATALVQSQEAWGLRWQWQWRTLAPFFIKGLDVKGTVIDLAFTLAYLALVIGVAVRMRVSYAIYGAAYLFFITMWGSLESVPRYGMGLFPVIMLLAVFGGNAAFDRIYLSVSAALAALFMAVFAVWGWVA